MDRRAAGQLDVAVLAQILSAQSVIQVLPSRKKKSEFCARALEMIPGVRRAFVCFLGEPISAGEWAGDCCATCPCPDSRPGEDINPCLLSGDDDTVVFPLATSVSNLGHVVIRTESRELFDPYGPFVRNLANVIALIVETRKQGQELRAANEELRRHRDRLEETVKERTRQLSVANDSLGKSRAWYRALFEQAGDYILVLARDAGGRLHVADASEAACVMHGYPREEFVGMPLEDFEEGWPDGESVSRLTCLEKGKPVVFETVHRRSNGTEFPVEVSANPFQLPGEPAMVVSMERDITERRQAEENQRKYEKDLKEAQRIAHLGTWWLDLRTNEVVWTEELYKMYGFDETRPPPPYTEHRKLFTPESWRLLSTSLENTRRTGVPYELELEMVVKDGSRRWMWVRGERVNDADGEAIGMWGAAQDITERKQAEEDRAQLEAKMQQAQKLESLGILAGGIAHDFNNILAAILGNADLALGALDENAQGQAHLRSIRTAAQRAADLVQQMLAYSGKSMLHMTEVDLSVLVGEMASLLGVSHRKNHVIDYRFQGGLPAIEGDASQLQQIVMNLITNASEAAGDDDCRILVETGVTDVTAEYLAATHIDDGLPGGRYVFLKVEDTGCGMAEETRKRIFEPFFTTKFLGRGLGMAAVLGIVQSHQGAIDIQSIPDQGTVITVLFPALGKKALLPDTEAPPSEDWTAQGTILMVDDEGDIRELVREMLERRGFRVLTAADGLRGVEVFREHEEEIACVLLDLTMPKMGGEEASRQIQQIRPGVPMILLSGYGENELEERVENLNFSGFLKKPFESRALLSKLRDILGIEVSTG